MAQLQLFVEHLIRSLPPGDFAQRATRIPLRKGVILMKHNGQRFFTITSILMMIGGAAGFVLGVIAVLAAGPLAALIGNTANFGLLMLGAILIWGSGVTGFVAGINGLKRASKPEKAMFYLLFGFLTAALTVAGNILSASGGGSFNTASLISGLVLPALCLIGEFLSKHHV